MRRFSAGVVTVGLLAMLLPAGGCVWKAEHDRALAANRRCNAELLKSQESLKTARGENQRLLASLSALNLSGQGRDEQIAILTQARNDLQGRLDRLQTLYDSLKAGPKLPERIGVLPPVLDKALRDFAAANPDLVEYLPRYGMVKLKSDLTFGLGSDEVRPDAQAALGKFVEIINSPAAAKFHVYVAGHTDDVPIKRAATRERHPDNWYLSVHRAVAVQQVLAAAGMDDNRIGAMGFGEYHPIAPNKPNKKGNAANRRVEIWIVPPDRLLTKGDGAADATK